MKKFVSKFFEGALEMLGIGMVLYCMIAYYEPRSKVFCNDIKLFEPSMTSTKVYQKHCKE